jgi:hypothetical protein
MVDPRHGVPTMRKRGASGWVLLIISVAGATFGWFWYSSQVADHKVVNGIIGAIALGICAPVFSLMVAVFALPLLSLIVKEPATGLSFVILLAGGAVLGGWIGSHYDANVGLSLGRNYALPGHNIVSDPGPLSTKVASGHTGGSIVGTLMGLFSGMIIFAFGSASEAQSWSGWLRYYMLFAGFACGAALLGVLGWKVGVWLELQEPGLGALLAVVGGGTAGLLLYEQIKGKPII